jgi:hypothetical protein
VDPHTLVKRLGTIKFTKLSTKSFREMQFASAPCSSRPITFFFLRPASLGREYKAWAKSPRADGVVAFAALTNDSSEGTVKGKKPTSFWCRMIWVYHCPPLPLLASIGEHVPTLLQREVRSRETERGNHC